MSGPFYVSAVFDKKFEEILPVTMTLMVAISFLMGIFGILKYSVYLIIILSIVLYVLGIYKLLKQKTLKQCISNFFTPGFVIYVILSIFFFITIKGKLFDSWDEFSHWGDIVKVMTTLDDFGTNVASKSIFKTYPPGMSLFQYLLEKLNFILTKEVFIEWLAYYSYYILAVSFLLPITKNISFNNILKIITYILIAIFVPFIFFNGVYYQLYIDPFLSFLITGGLISLFREDDIYSDILVASNVFMLVLAKDAGLLFATVLAVAAIIKRIFKNNGIKASKDTIITTVLMVSCVLLPKLLWSFNIKKNGAKGQFSEKIDFGNLIKVLTGRDDGYRYTVLKNYITAFVTRGVDLGNTGIHINYLALLVISIIAIIFVNNHGKKINKIVSNTTIIGSTIIFIIGTCVSYMYKFSQSEAVGLASFDRYINIVFLMMWLYISLTAVDKYSIARDYQKICSVIICLLFVVSPLEIIVPYSMRSSVKASVNIRANYTELVNKTLKYADGDDEIWFIAQETQGFERLVYKFGVRPNLNDAWWSIGEPFYEGDEYTQTINCEQWKEELKNNFDYVAIYNLNDYFYENFTAAFENTDEIFENCLYKVNKDTGLLELCE